MLVIGSVALNEYDALQRNRKMRDTDYICTFDEFRDWCDEFKPKRVEPIHQGKKYVAQHDSKIHEFEIAWPDSSGELLLELIKDQPFARNRRYTYADPELVYTLKMSHRFLKNSPHFNKTMDDIIHLRGHGIRIPKYLKQWLKIREKETYFYRHPSLKQSKKDFFNGDGVDYVYDHDSIHVAVKHGERPAYTYFKAEDADVYCLQEKFEKLDDAIKLNSVIEESYVLAIERCLLHYDDVTPQRAFLMALQKVCTSITSGWWRDYAYDHYYDAVNYYHQDFYDHFNAEVAKGNVAPAE